MLFFQICQRRLNGFQGCLVGGNSRTVSRFFLCPDVCLDLPEHVAHSVFFIQIALKSETIFQNIDSQTCRFIFVRRHGLAQ
ncbi:hypothetical protein Y981_08255 [Leptospirillum ferriphilum YSK]|uniref:Uncharacterized protein n=1 Tax=Leptospirillum ferriphilum YSK TaxID=1441628 RepID=A0A059Y2N3_9BACT|nr:hypothetical protein Y981_08255 [Leptospirillum ferriphilum YSK]